MAKDQLKTIATDIPLNEFMDKVDENRINEAKTLLNLFKKVTGKKPIIWNDVIGYGSYSYTRSDKKTFEWYRTGFAPRKSKLTIYIMPGYDLDQELLAQLGKHKSGKSCIYINKLEDIDINVLEKLVKNGFEKMKKLAPED